MDAVVTDGLVTRQLCVKDLEVFQIENKCMEKHEYPFFWVYYCTAISDFFGKLTFGRTEMVFEPLNENFQGYMNYDSSIKLS